jgi:hypothetical protein
VNYASRLLVGALLAAALVLAAAGSATSDDRPAAHAAGEDSPWPDTNSVPANLRAVKSVVRDLEDKVALMELSASRYANWEACIHGVPVSEYGDQDRQWGYVYDERDGTGTGYMSALAVDRKSRPRKEDYLFLNFSNRGNCRSNAPLSGGTADPASVRPAAAARASRRPGARRSTLRRLEQRVRAMKRSARRLLDSSERFDEWESCVSWVPVTEYGDPDGKFGYSFGPRGGAALGYRPAITIDRSDWDDPEYQFLALVGGDRPGRTCQDEPGEAVD